ncbi:MAG: lactate utilization protein [Chloroflexi bacterium]|jgi:L-lactate dehydrogenase complex protein LldG|nr:lactate utilization protein [Chloroflexota bacterium]MBT7004400.1 lactate utilization protein [Chloroflexota bacterium]
MADRAKFIAGVTAGLGRTEVLSPTSITETAGFEDAATAKANAVKASTDALERSKDLADQMAEEAAKAGWKVHRASNSEDAVNYVARICIEKKATSVLRSNHDAIDQIGVEAAITNAGATLETTEHHGENSQAQIEKSKSKAFSADIGITGVDYAIAETGTVVLHPRSGLSRLVSLAPPTHIAVLRPGEVLDSLDELFAMERNDFMSGELAGSMNLISGPSKTADIEGTTVTGIHGPLEVHLVILADE